MTVREDSFLNQLDLSDRTSSHGKLSCDSLLALQIVMVSDPPHVYNVGSHAGEPLGTDVSPIDHRLTYVATWVPAACPWTFIPGQYQGAYNASSTAYSEVRPIIDATPAMCPVFALSHH